MVCGAGTSIICAVMRVATFCDCVSDNMMVTSSRLLVGDIVWVQNMLALYVQWFNGVSILELYQTRVLHAVIIMSVGVVMLR